MEKLICIHCGSKKVAEYIYGLPVFTDDFIEKLANGEVVTGGCEVSEMNPRYKCQSCYEDFGYFHSIPSFIPEVCFVINGFDGYEEYKFIMNSNLEFFYSYSLNHREIIQKDLDLDEWLKVINRLNYRYCVFEWKNQFADGSTLSKVQWQLGIKLGLEGINYFSYKGNEHHPYWNNLQKLFKSYRQDEL